MMQKSDPSQFIEPARSTEKEVHFRIQLEKYFTESIGSNVEKLQNFPKYVPTQDVRKFLCRYELYKKILHVHGSIIECGVLFGGGLMAWGHLSEIFEPINHLRNIIGFDTFTGFTSLSDKDLNKSKKPSQCKIGGLAIDSYDDLLKSIELFNQNRFLNHIEKIKLVKGNAVETIPKYLRENPYLVISLLYLDFDTYEPTLAALKHLTPRMPKGGIIAFDELSHEIWPGETIAVIEELGLANMKIERFPWGGTISYAKL